MSYILFLCFSSLGWRRWRFPAALRRRDSPATPAQREVTLVILPFLRRNPIRNARVIIKEQWQRSKGHQGILFISHNSPESAEFMFSGWLCFHSNFFFFPFWGKAENCGRENSKTYIQMHKISICILWMWRQKSFYSPRHRRCLLFIICVFPEIWDPAVEESSRGGEHTYTHTQHTHTQNRWCVKSGPAESAPWVLLKMKHKPATGWGSAEARPPAVIYTH